MGVRDAILSIKPPELPRGQGIHPAIERYLKDYTIFIRRVFDALKEENFEADVTNIYNSNLKRLHAFSRFQIVSVFDITQYSHNCLIHFDGSAGFLFDYGTGDLHTVGSADWDVYNEGVTSSILDGPGTGFLKVIAGDKVVPDTSTPAYGYAKNDLIIEGSEEFTVQASITLNKPNLDAGVTSAGIMVRINHSNPSGTAGGVDDFEAFMFQVDWARDDSGPANGGMIGHGWGVIGYQGAFSTHSVTQPSAITNDPDADYPGDTITLALKISVTVLGNTHQYHMFVDGVEDGSSPQNISPGSYPNPTAGEDFDDYRGIGFMLSDTEDGEDAIMNVMIKASGIESLPEVTFLTDAGDANFTVVFGAEFGEEIGEHEPDVHRTVNHMAMEISSNDIWYNVAFFDRI